jgi:hypothetical protein
MVTHKCKRCAQSFVATTRHQRFCSQACRYASRLHAPLDRFWSKVQKTEDCWRWLAQIGPDGYGCFFLKEYGRSIHAHRALYHMLSGHKLTPSDHVCHTCDNRWCVRPDHLFLAEREDNMSDMVNKGRSTWGDKHWTRQHPGEIPHGSRHYRSRLTEDDVHIIRAESAAGVSRKELAERFKIARTTITKIARGYAWKYVE